MIVIGIILSFISLGFLCWLLFSLICFAKHISEYVVQPDMWRRSGSSAVLGETDVSCATYLRGYSKRRNSMTSGRRDQPPDVLRVRP